MMTRIAHTGALYLVLQIVVAAAFGSDSIVIAQMLGTPAVADYAVPERMFSLITMLLAMVTGPLWPAYGEAIARGDAVWVRRTLSRSIALAVGSAALMSTILVIFGSHLVTLWVGRSIDPPFALIVGLGVWKVFEAGGTAVGAYLNGAHIIRFQLITALLTGVSALGLKFVFVGWCGVSGTVWATTLSYLMFAALPYAIFLPRLLQGNPHAAVAKGELSPS
jgi:O-antigen/teichoic acid export membrane protein